MGRWQETLAALLASLALVGCGSTSKGETTVKSDELEQDSEAPTERRSQVPDVGEDEGDDEGLEVEGLKGHLDRYDIEKGVKPHSEALARCYEDQARKKHYLGGTVELAYTVARTGAVKSVQIAKSDLGSWIVEKCLLELGRDMSFAKPKGGDADFSLPLEFKPRRGPLWWTEEQAEAEVAQRVVELKDCATDNQLSDPRNVWVTLYLGRRGEVQDVGFASPAPQPIEDAWAECAAAKVLSWELTDPRGKIAKLSFRYNPE